LRQILPREVICTRKKVTTSVHALSRGGEIMGPVPFYKTNVKRTERKRRT